MAPARVPGVLGAKLAHLEAEGDQYDVLFVGAGRAFRGIDPHTFDASMARFGRPTRSFNLSAPPLAAIEQEHVIDLILEMDLAGLQWLIVNPDSIRLQLHDRNVASGRAVGWHDPRGTRTVLGVIASRQHQPLVARCSLIRSHLQSFLINRTLRGQLFELTLSSIGGPPALPNEMALGPGGVEAHGLRIIFISIPGDEYAAERRWLRRNDFIDDVADLNSPQKDPALFDRDLWWGRGHLNSRRAKTLSHKLAREVHARLKDEDS